MDRLLEATFRAEEQHFWFHGFRAFVRPLVARATAGIDRPDILDCGCGTGANLSMLGGFGRPFGLDLTASGLQFARGRGLSRLIRGTVGMLPVPSERFDLVTSFDVLYSLERDVERDATAEMYRVLRPGGHAIVNVAALEILKGPHSKLGRELRRYSKPQLRRLLESAGFEVLRLTYTNASIFPLMLSKRLLQRLTGADDEARADDLDVPAGVVNRLLIRVLLTEAAVLRHVELPIGSSLLCLARRPR